MHDYLPSGEGRALLLVTGSRALARMPMMVEWATRWIDHYLVALPKGSYVLSGGCPDSPDRWATQLAGGLGIRWVEYRLDGYRYASDEPRRPWRRGRCIHPHERNRALVDAALRAQEAGWRVGCLALIHPRSPTRGAAVTAAMAEGEGLWTTRLKLWS